MLDHPDSILVIGVLVARMLYDVSCPVVVGDIAGGDGEIVTVEG